MFFGVSLPRVSEYRYPVTVPGFQFLTRDFLGMFNRLPTNLLRLLKPAMSSTHRISYRRLFPADSLSKGWKGEPDLRHHQYLRGGYWTMFARLTKHYWPCCEIVQNTAILCGIGNATSVKQAKLNNINMKRASSLRLQEQPTAHYDCRL
jgi:hypothetical protein